ncbi:MAG: S24 family peptidase [Elusimicrobiales bacterium]
MNRAMTFAELLARYNGGKSAGAQKKLAQALDTGIYNVCHWNSGRCTPSSDMRLRVAAELGVSVDELISALDCSRRERAGIPLTIDDIPPSLRCNSASPVKLELRDSAQNHARAAAPGPAEYTAVAASISGPEFRMRDIPSMVAEEFLPVPQHGGQRQTVALRVRGGGLKPLAADGEYLLVALTSFAEDGSIALVHRDEEYTIGVLRWVDGNCAEITAIGGRTRRLKPEEIAVAGKLLLVLRKPCGY